MKFISYIDQDRPCAGIVLGHEVLNLATAAARLGEAADLSSVLAIVRGGEAALSACGRLASSGHSVPQALVPLERVRLLAPIPSPARNAFCVGRNYVEHVREGAAAMGTAMALPKVPQFFTKATHAINDPQGEIRLDRRVTKRLDYEVELAVVIGRGGRDIPAASAYDHIFGYTVANDVTARDLQRRHDQWFKGKSLDGTLPMGPVLVSSDEIGDVRTLELSLTVNGQERQRARVEEMIFDIPTIIASLSAGLTLEPGDIICTGTAAGVGFAMEPPQYLQNGDEVVARIDRIGELRNRIVEV